MHVNMDPNFVDNMVNEVKSQGVFDAFRKDSMADVDTKPAYQNLKQRVENNVAKFLAEQRWTPETNKNQLRERLRKHIIDAGFLEVGVQRIVDQVVNPKIATVFQPKIEEIVYKYLGVEKPEAYLQTLTEPKSHNNSGNNNLSVKINLLPTDLEAVSPDSDKSTEKYAAQKMQFNINTQDGNEDEDDESPPFEPLEGPSPNKYKESDERNFARSCVSDLTSQSEDMKVDKQIEIEKPSSYEKSDQQNFVSSELNQESQLSQVSSTSRLSVVSNIQDKIQNKEKYTQGISSTNVDICEEAQMPKFSENSNSCQPINGDTLHFDIKKDEIKFEGTERNEILPPVYKTSMIENTEEIKRSERKTNISQNIEEVSNGSFNTDSHNSTYFDDDSEKGVLHIVEDPSTQDISREPSRPSSSNNFQKPESKDEKCSDDKNNLISNKTSLEDSTEEKKSDDKTDNTIIEKANSTEKLSNTSSYEKQKSSKSESSHRHSSSHSHKSNKKSKRSDRDKDKNRKKSSVESPRKDNKDYKSNGSGTSSNNKGSSKHSTSHKRSSEKDRDRKRDNDRSREDKSSKSVKQKSRENDDHSSEKSKRHHRKSTDSNDGDKKGNFNLKNQNYKGQSSSTLKSSEELRKSGDNFNKKENSTQDNDNSSNNESIAPLHEEILKHDVEPKEVVTTCHESPDTLKNAEINKNANASIVLIDNFNRENMELIIESKTSEINSSALSNENKIVICNEEKQSMSHNQENPKSETKKVDEHPTVMINETVTKSVEKVRFETLISPPPKKRKYDINYADSFTNDNTTNQNNQPKIYIPNFESTDDEDNDVNLFGFDVQEEQDNFYKIIKDYEEYYDKFFGKNIQPNSTSDSFLNSCIMTNEINNKNELESSESVLELCDQHEVSDYRLIDENNISGKSLLINCFDYDDLVPGNTLKKNTNKVVSSTIKNLNCKTSPSLSEASISSKENEFLGKNNQNNNNINNRKGRGGESKATQRYSCDDLYKPRLSLSHRSRRRALENENS